jgi:hypothetical protein
MESRNQTKYENIGKRQFGMEIKNPEDQLRDVARVTEGSRTPDPQNHNLML